MAKPSEPKGGKLDAKKRAEYESTVASASDWDTAGWPSWIVTGRVLPERCNVSVPAWFSKAMGAGGRCLGRFQVTNGHVVATIKCERADVSVFEIVDLVRSSVQFPVDYIAFCNRGAYEVVLDVLVNNITGEASTIPIFEPMFTAEEVGLCFDAKADTSRIVIPWDIARVPPELPTALHDLTSAVRYPRRTFDHCRMAIEVIRRHFDPATIKGQKDRQIAGEKNMCEALRLARKSLTALDAVAARSRHGHLVFSINWEKRRRALEFAWEVVARFTAFLRKGSDNSWKILDVRIED